MSGQKIIDGLNEALDHAKDEAATEVLVEGLALLDGTTCESLASAKEWAAQSGLSGSYYGNLVADAEQMNAHLKARGFKLVRAG